MRQTLSFGLLLLVTATTAVADNLDDVFEALFTDPPPISNVGNSRPSPTPAANPCDNGQRCVHKYLCTNASTTGEGRIDIRFNGDNPCVDYLLQCCYEEDIIQSPVPSPVVPVMNQPSCGKRQENGIGFRITGGVNNEAEYGEFPWMMAILNQVKLLGQAVFVYRCGGSLIHPKVVLTGAHCVQNKSPNELKVRGGEWDTQTTNEVHEHQDRAVTERVTHPDYYKGGLFNDVALLFLDSPFNMNEAIQPVCLPPQDAKFDHQRCFVSGWGQDVFEKSGIYQAILKKIELPVVPSTQCQSSLRASWRPNFELHKSFICAGGEKGKDACKGDGGSPLVCPVTGSQDHYQQAGLVSWGVGCGTDQLPGMYADVASFRNWIDQQMRSRQLDIGSYSP